MLKKRILIACEESQIVTNLFREIGFEAYSCDILPTSGPHPEWHIKHDIKDILKQKWDAIIAFPPCTYLTVTGNRWFNIDRYGENAIKRMDDRQKAISLFLSIANANCDYIAIENPVGIMSTEYRKPDQIINPFQFGDPHEKRTCLWLKGLPKLIHTNIVDVPDRIIFKSGKTMPEWYAKASKFSKEERSIIRSKTFYGIAKAMADQWGEFLKNN